MAGTIIVGKPFDGKDKDKWHKETMTLAGQHGGIRPAWQLFVEGDSVMTLMIEGGLTRDEALKTIEEQEE